MTDCLAHRIGGHTRDAGPRVNSARTARHAVHVQVQVQQTTPSSIGSSTLNDEKTKTDWTKSTNEKLIHVLSHVLSPSKLKDSNLEQPTGTLKTKV